MAKRSGFDEVLIDSTTGLPMYDVECTVYDANNSQATVYQTKAGGSLVAQPIVTESSNGGLVQFWAEPGYYEVEVEDTEIPARFATRRIPFNAVAGDADGIAESQIDYLVNYFDASDIFMSQVYGTSSLTLSSIPPGKYIGSLITASTAKQGITVASGSASISNGLPAGAQNVVFLLTVTSTASISFNPETSSHSQLVIYGLKN
jgi:hypothetical protein